MRPNAIGSFGAVAVTVRHRHTVWQAHVQCPASTSSAASAHEPLGGRISAADGEQDGDRARKGAPGGH